MHAFLVSLGHAIATRTVLVSPIAARSKFHATIGLVCVFLTARLRAPDASNHWLYPIELARGLQLS